MTFKWTVLVIACCLFCACVHQPIAVKQIDKIPASEKLVFGELVAANIKPGTQYKIFIRRDGDGQEFCVNCVKDKSGEKFYWHLRPGRYTITNFQIYAGIGRIWVKFEVPEHGDAVYIGRLEMLMSVVSHMQIRDDMAAAEAALRGKVTSKDYVVVKRLMQKEI